jgi:hypothetical protein
MIASLLCLIKTIRMVTFNRAPPAQNLMRFRHFAVGRDAPLKSPALWPPTNSIHPVFSCSLQP